MKKEVIYNGGALILRESPLQWGQVDVITTRAGQVYSLDWDELLEVHGLLAKYIEKTRPKIAELEDRLAERFA